MKGTRNSSRVSCYEWSRSWIKTVRFDSRGEPDRIQSFGNKLSFRAPIDLALGPDGALYMLEWGLRAHDENDSGLYRVEFKR